MAIKRSKAPAGTLVVLEHHSRVLRDNPWGDPSVRKLAVWLPPQYDQAAGVGRKQASQARFPVFYDMVGFTGSGLSHAGWRAFSYNLPERVAHYEIGNSEKFERGVGRWRGETLMRVDPPGRFLPLYERSAEVARLRERCRCD